MFYTHVHSRSQQLFMAKKKCHDMQNKQGGKQSPVFNGCDWLIQKSKSKPDIERRLLKEGYCDLLCTESGCNEINYSDAWSTTC